MKHESGIRNLLSAGHTVKEVAEKLGLSYSYTRLIMTKSGIKVPPQARVNQARRIMGIAKLMTEGKTAEEIAEAVGISEVRVRELQLQAGLRSKRAKRPGQIKELLDSGKAVTEIASELGIKTKTVYEVCSRNGIKIRGRSQEREQEVRKEILRLRGLGISDDGIAYAVGLKPELVYTYRPGPKGRPKNGNQKLVVEALRRGESVDDICQSLNLLPGTVIGYGRKNGFSFKRSYALCGKEGV